MHACRIYRKPTTNVLKIPPNCIYCYFQNFEDSCLPFLIDLILFVKLNSSQREISLSCLSNYVKEPQKIDWYLKCNTLQTMVATKSFFKKKTYLKFWIYHTKKCVGKLYVRSKSIPNRVFFSKLKFLKTRELHRPRSFFI